MADDIRVKVIPCKMKRFVLQLHCLMPNRCHSHYHTKQNEVTECFDHQSRTGLRINTNCYAFVFSIWRIEIGGFKAVLLFWLNHSSCFDITIAFHEYKWINLIVMPILTPKYMFVRACNFSQTLPITQHTAHSQFTFQCIMSCKCITRFEILKFKWTKWISKITENRLHRLWPSFAIIGGGLIPFVLTKMKITH